MRTLTMILMTALLAGVAGAESLDAFKARIESAVAQPTEPARAVAVEALYYTAGTDAQTRGFMDRAVGMLARRRGAEVSFAPLDPDFPLVNVLNGYEYRPNLEPLGLVKLSGDELGGSSQLPYAKRGDRYVFPATVRRLVNADAEPDSTLQIITIGMANPPLTFTGWCDVELSDRSIQRRKISDNGVGNNTLAFRAQAFKACEVRNTAGRGSLSLRLLVGDDTLFEHRVTYPDVEIRYTN